MLTENYFIDGCSNAKKAMGENTNKEKNEKYIPKRCFGIEKVLNGYCSQNREKEIGESNIEKARFSFIWFTKYMFIFTKHILGEDNFFK